MVCGLLFFNQNKINYESLKMKEFRIESTAKETKLNGLSSFSLDYVVKWPLSLIINRKVISKFSLR